MLVGFSAAMANIGVSYCLHDDYLYVPTSMAAFCRAGLKVTAFISRCAWDQPPGDWERCVEAVQSVDGDVEVVIGDWGDESLHRSSALASMRERGNDYVFIPDGDEVPEPSLLEALLKIASTELAGASFDEVLWEAIRTSPDAIGPRLRLARGLLERGDEARAHPVLQDLERRGVAEAAFLQGVCASRRGDFTTALSHMREALRLNPGHDLTAQQVRALEEAVAAC